MVKDDIDPCPRCGDELSISKVRSVFYECRNPECGYKEYMWPSTPKDEKTKGGKKMDKQEKKRHVKIKSIDKSSAIQLCLDRGINIRHKTCTFSSQNQGITGNKKYWANPDFEKLQHDWWLILNDIDRKQLYVFFIPALEIKRNELQPRNDQPNKIDLQIFYNDHHYPHFTDSISKISFKRWLKETIPY